MGLIGFALGAAFLTGVIVWAIGRGNEGARKALYLVLPFLLIALVASVVVMLDVWMRATEPLASVSALQRLESHERVLVAGTVGGDAQREWVWTSGAGGPRAIEVVFGDGMVTALDPDIEAAERYGQDLLGLRHGVEVLVFGSYWKADDALGEGDLYAASLPDYRSRILWRELGPAAVAGAIALLGLFGWVVGFRRRANQPTDF